MRIFLTLLLLMSIQEIIAQNPITPPGMYIADPEAHVWKDGKLYIYGSRDESDDYWCSYTHHVLSTSNLTDWDITENVFASKGENDQVKFHDNLLFAPDAAYKNGTYYLYFCSPGKPKIEGVATSKNPNGPFVNGKQIKDAFGIDPAVLIDDDGQAYYFWGQGKPKVAKLKPNMMEIDKSTIIYPLDEKGNVAFHEGSSIRKIGDLYYLVFADDSRENRPTCLGYAIGSSPMGPFEYKGVIIDNYNCDPSSWNNHGSIEKFKGQWYVFYHRSTNNSQKFRKACIEPIYFNEDGTIDEVEMTSQGAGKPLNPTNRIEAEWTCGLSGNVRVSTISKKDIISEGLSEIKNNDTAIYKYFSFEDKLTSFEVKTSPNSEGIIEIRLDNAKGKLIGTITIKPKNENTAYKISTGSIKKINKGKHALHFTFKNNSDSEFSIDWFKFN
ncbi:family 43 glycosylhydrolase [Lutibacter sp. TH_r2]|uniref:family 43 glycosylhydrolase n=1 Tax=Lutibacter sp. TH_r2 TaxID=3082083 RepID=UPI0029559161|nr:family 43 glycosylhydrolase [Lutibacter sp. TH_r2]MDV7185952.1 family 43 glycosylhydrolase [Lutibacter sp. TH_r2]